MTRRPSDLVPPLLFGASGLVSGSIGWYAAGPGTGLAMFAGPGLLATMILLVSKALDYLADTRRDAHVKALAAEAMRCGVEISATSSTELHVCVGRADGVRNVARDG